MMKKKVILGMVLFSTIISLLIVQQLPVPVFAYNSSAGIHWDSDSCDYEYSSLNSDWRGEVNSAASTWSNCGADFTLSYDSGSSYSWYDGNEWPSTWVGYTHCYWTLPDKHLYNVYSVFNTFWTFDDSGSPAANELDVETVALHEFGHWLHLDHSDEEDATMWQYVDLGERDVTLLWDDVLGIIDIYGP